MIQAPQDNIIVSIKSKYTKDFGSLTRRLSIGDATSVHLEDFAQLKGIVVSLPKEISKTKTENGYSMEGIEVGDTILFAFNVVFDFYQNAQPFVAVGDGAAPVVVNSNFFFMFM